MDWIREIITRNLGEWNAILLIIGGCSILSLGVFIERLLSLRNAEVDTSTLVIHLRKALGDQNIIEAIRICDTTGGAACAIIKSGLMRHDRTKEEIETGMEITGLTEIARLEKNAKILSLIAYIAPLIGLLGTVLGFIQAFAEMRQAGLMDISATRIGEAMEYALVTTAAGLAVAIPTVVAYNYLVSRIKGVVLEIQTLSAEVVDLLVHRKDPYEI